MKSNKTFNGEIHSFGIISTAIIVVLMLSVPVVTCIVFGIWPDFNLLMPAFISASMILAPYCFAESIAYPPIMGPGAVYMAYVSGNTTTIKMPCALSALAIADIEQGTDEANAVSLIAVGTSTLTVIAIIIVGIFLSAPLAPILNNPALQPSFKQIVPALMGALLGGSILGKSKYFAAPLAVGLVITHLSKIPAAYGMLITIAIAIGVGCLLTNREAKAKNAD